MRTYGLSIKDVACWTEEVTDEESLKTSSYLALPHIRHSGRFRPVLEQLLRDRDYHGLAEMELDYRYDDDVMSLVNARQALAFFSKYERLPLGVDKEAVAYAKFLAAEKQCAETNTFIRALESGDLCLPARVSQVIFLASRKIARILGNVPALEELEFSFGPGANTSVKALEANARAKLHAPFACSAELLSMASAVLGEAPSWVSAHAVTESESSWFVDVEIHVGKLQFVPKNAKTYRSIVVEPCLNSFAQKGVGSYIRGCLLRAGLDLSDQSRNQRLARIGSLTGNLATVDLSSASDTISKEVVGHLLPYEWYSLLSSFRTGTVEYAGKRHTLEKFSSMGNAFTFELESLIFWTLAVSTCDALGLPKAWTTAYGDDIIVPYEAYGLLSEVLGTLGFTVNVQKTFADGPFRESCGKDYFLGSDVRPFYLKDRWSPMRLFILHNFYMRNCDLHSANRVRKLIHPSLRLFGPDGYGDGHLIGSWSRRAREGSTWGGGTFETFTLRGRHLRHNLSRGDRVLPAYSVYVRSGQETSTQPYVVRGSKGYKRIQIYTFREGIFT